MERDENKKTYKDFAIGQTVWCKDITGTKHDWLLDNNHVTVGEEYIITDLEFKFPDTICIKTNKGHGMFLNIEIFEDNIAVIRDKTIDEVLKDK